MTNSKRFASLVVAGVVAASPLLVASAASANEDFRSCSADGHTLNASAKYTLSNTQHLWTTYYGKLGGDGTGGKSNLNMRVTESSVSVWYHASADNIGQGEQYSKSFEGLRTTRTKTEVLKLTAIFDEPGGDDQCNAIWNY